MQNLYTNWYMQGINICDQTWFAKTLHAVTYIEISDFNKP